MIQTLTFGLTEVRVWSGERVTPVLSCEHWRSRTLAAGPRQLREVHIGLEAYVPIGAMIRYGLLGIQVTPTPGSNVELHVPCVDGPGWSGSRLGPRARVTLGLHEEFVGAVQDALAAELDRQIASAAIRVIETAQDAVGSSRQMFAVVAHTLGRLLLDGVDDESRVRAIVERGLRGFYGGV